MTNEPEFTEARSHLITTRSGDHSKIPVKTNEEKNLGGGNQSGGSFDCLRCCSSVTARCGDAPFLTPSRQPKSLAAPSALIYEMASKKTKGTPQLEAPCGEGGHQDGFFKLLNRSPNLPVEPVAIMRPDSSTFGTSHSRQ